MTTDVARLGRTMSHALRHAPEAYDLVLDCGGWTLVDDLAAGIARALREPVTPADLEHVVAVSMKPRYERSGAWIRAAYGHTVPVRLDAEPGRSLPAASSPVTLCCGAR